MIGIEITDDDLKGIAWWNHCTEEERRYWLDRADSACPVDAWRAYKLSGERERDRYDF